MTIVVKLTIENVDLRNRKNLYNLVLLERLTNENVDLRNRKNLYDLVLHDHS
jgi:hypothetical protein